MPFLVACLGIATFAGMDALMKELAIALGAYNAMLWRTGIALLIATLLFLGRRTAWPPLDIIKVHVWRGLVTSVMAFLFFWGLVYVPIAEAIALTFIAPLIALYLAAWLLGERVGPQSVLASCIGFLGGLVILSGKLAGSYDSQVWLGITAILCSAVLYAYNLILQRRQALIANPVEIALFQNITVVSVYSLLAPFFAVIPTTELAGELIAAAALGLVSMMMLSWAYARAEAKVLIPVEYTAFAWAAVLGYLMFDETVTWPTLLGTTLIVTGCLMAAYSDRREPEHVETTAL